MSVTLWINEAKEEALDLGPTLAVYGAFAEMSRAAGPAWQAEYEALSGVLSQCEIQEDADPKWLAEVSEQASRLLRERGAHLSDFAHRLLAELAHGREVTP